MDGLVKLEDEERDYFFPQKLPLPDFLYMPELDKCSQKHFDYFKISYIGYLDSSFSTWKYCAQMLYFSGSYCFSPKQLRQMYFHLNMLLCNHFLYILSLYVHIFMKL